MRQTVLFLILALVIVVIMIVGGAFFVVDETQQVVITQFGNPVGDPIVTPGLKVKIPFIQKVNYFDKRFLEWDGSPNQVPTRDKRFIYIDTYARWRISDPLRYAERLYDEIKAQSRLDDILDGETRNVVASHDLIEVVRSSNRVFEVTGEVGGGETQTLELIEFGRSKLAQEVLKAAQKRTTDLGIEILDFRFKRINYVEEVRKEVYARMISERKRIAEQFRSEGAGEAASINGKKERELKQITSEAYRKAQEIKGRADAEAADIYAEAYNRDPDFYRFLKTMEILKETLDEKTVMVLSTEGDFLRYINQMK
jgi:membrane protease subunit HflC